MIVHKLSQQWLPLSDVYDRYSDSAPPVGSVTPDGFQSEDCVYAFIRGEKPQPHDGAGHRIIKMLKVASQEISQISLNLRGFGVSLHVDANPVVIR